MSVINVPGFPYRLEITFFMMVQSKNQTLKGLPKLSGRVITLIDNHSAYSAPESGLIKMIFWLASELLIFDSTEPEAFMRYSICYTHAMFLTSGQVRSNGLEI